MADNVYRPGDLVWAKLAGHLWWPALICNIPQDDVNTNNDNITGKLHVQFFSTPPSHAWINIKSLHPYEGKNAAECKAGGMFYSSRKSMFVSLSKIEKAQFLTHQERLKRFCSEGKGVKQNKPTIHKQNMEETKTSLAMHKRYIIGKTKIPTHWKQAFVLMDTADVPEDLKPGQVYHVPEAVSKKMKLEVLVDIESDVNDIDSEDELVDSDEDPGWKPEGNDSELCKKEQEKLPNFVDDISDDDDVVDDSDNDTSWTPGKTNSSVLKKSTQERKRKHSKSDQRITSKSCKTPSKSQNLPNQETSSPSKGSSEEKSPKLLVIQDNTPTGPEPLPGEFVLEKSACNNGDIPHLWQYKKGGLIQKYEKNVENGRELYVSVQSFSDWWSCYAHKYQKVETKLLYRYRNTEKVELFDKPEIQAEEIQSGYEVSKHNTSTRSHHTGEPSMQEQEISSTTTGFNDQTSFQIGRFVLDLKDRSNMDNFPIWKIESHILLKKYEAVVKKGRLLHKPVKTYRGYRDIEKQYLPVKVNVVKDLFDELVEVTEETKPKVIIDSSLEEEYEKNPLLRHFYVYMQVFLSQALEPGFLAEVKKTNDPTYMFPLSEIDKIVEQKKINIERKVKWSQKIQDVLNKCPYLREVHKPDDNKTCEGKANSKELVEESVFLFGSVYDKDTLKQSGSSYSATEFRIGKTSMEFISTYHQLCHFKYNLYDRCLAKIKLIRDSHEDIEVEKIMDKCLGNKTWVLQNFEHFMNLVEIM